MTTAQVRRAKQCAERLAAVEAEVAALSAARDSLLDVVNAILAHSGGKLVVPDVEVLAAGRHHVKVDVRPGYYVFELEGYERKGPGGLLARLGLARGQ